MAKGKDQRKLLWQSPAFVLLGVALVFLCWWGYSAYLVSQGNSAYLFPGPVMVLSRFFTDLGSSKVWGSFLWTLLRVLIAFAVSFVFGFALGLLSGLFKPLRLVLKPFLVLMRTLPTAAITFVIVIMAGVRWAPVYLGILVMFPIVYESVLQGVMEIPDDLCDQMALDGGMRAPLNVAKVVVPLSSPYGLLGMVTSLGLGMKVCVMAEIVCGGNSSGGIGRLIYVAAQIDLDSVEVMSLSLLCVITIGLADLGLYFLKRFLAKKGLVEAK